MKSLVYSDSLFSKEPVGITNGTLTLIEQPSVLVDPEIAKHHYSHKTTKNRFLSFSVNGDKGYLQLGYGIRPHIKHTISSLITKDNFCEFDRMWLSDELPKYSETQVISLLISYLKQRYHQIKFVITYADESAGNVGTIYKASNAISIGSVPVDFYLLPSGERIHPVSMYHRHKTRAWNFLTTRYPGIRHLKGQFKQYRYLYILDKKLRKQYENERTCHDEPSHNSTPRGFL